MTQAGCFAPLATRRALGFDALLEKLAAHAQTPFGRERVKNLSLDLSPSQTRERLKLFSEGRLWAERKVQPDFAGIKDVRDALTLVDRDGVLGAIDIRLVGQTLEAAGRVRRYVESRRDEWPALWSVAETLADERGFAERVTESIDEEGHLTDAASPELASRRGQVQRLRAEAQRILDEEIATADDMGVLQDRNFTVRHDRYVLPVKAEFQRRVEGIVHDASQTGQTVYVEPRALLHVGNRITVARAAVKEEEHRILAAFSIQIRQKAAVIESVLGIAGELEQIFIIGGFAAAIDGREVVPTGLRIALRGARHPVLALLHSEGRHGPIVEQDIDFGGRDALIVSGPNAGGKTVALKTAGLLALLARAGVPVSAGADSEIPAYAAVFAVIGDAQSIERSVSTFSGHLQALAAVNDALALQTARGPVLVLLDEICAGTAPEQGAALAQALLESMVEQGAHLLVTTHYERLKMLGVVAETRDRFRNASVALDTQNVPTFLLESDEVGASSAFAAAQKFGLPQEIVARAEALADPDSKAVQAMLSSLSEAKAELVDEKRALHQERARIAEKRAKLTERLRVIDQKERELKHAAFDDLFAEIAEARKAVAASIERAQGGASPKVLNEVSHTLKKAADAAKRQAESLATITRELPPEDLKIGMRVVTVSMPDNVLEVTDVDGDTVTLGRGPFSLRVPRDEVRLGGRKAERREKARAPARGVRAASPKNTQNALDVRGKRVEEALEVLDAFLDRMVADGERRCFVVHGHGTGALKRAIREHLKVSGYVKRSAPAERGDGGDGATVIDLDVA